MNHLPSTMTRFEVLDHTADVAIRAWGETLTELFENAAAGMFGLIAEVDEAEPEYEHELSVEALDRETLLVGWLRELLLRFELQGEFPIRFSVEVVTEDSLKATVAGVRFDPSRHELLRHVKAVTYHDLHVEQSDDTWQATIVFDT